MTLLGAADLLWLMGDSMRAEYKQARAWINDVITFERDFQADFFTLSMTFLGSLLALHDLTGDGMYLKKAINLADRTTVAYEASSSGWPWRNVNLRTGKQRTGEVSGNVTNVGEAASATLEFSKLTYITGDHRYKRAAYQLWHLLDRAPEGTWDGLVNTWWDVTNGSWLPGPNGTLDATWGGMGDLAYEYMLKTWVLSGGRDEVSLRLYTSAMRGMRKHILNITSSGTAWLSDVSWDPKTGSVTHGSSMQHLACFAGATIALGHMHGINTASQPGEPDDLAVAEAIAGGCYQMYRQSPSGLNAHAVDSLNGTHATPTAGQAYYDQQPELLESLFYLWRITGNATYRDWGWQIFRAMRMWTRLPNGAFACLASPTQAPFNYIDNTQEWWLSESMKYLWLLFSDHSVLPLEEWVINTEGHPYRAQRWASSSSSSSSSRSQAAGVHWSWRESGTSSKAAADGVQ
ncbi:hypothetical protein OEZ85_000844 [Tetradesmus obliquus]|uniref:alpha-1,2-Mannosidase n=1 Tax=Tetradesmus obliquus TaxID=3088 RepID=A0ABY8UJX4_TETOB|nr:hypothetical protein OEZ85_000844 [Tetradesmus obliquus]